MQEARALSLDQENPLEEEMAVFLPLQCSCLENPTDVGAWLARFLANATEYARILGEVVFLFA